MTQEFDIGPGHYRLEGDYLYISYAPNAIITFADAKAFIAKQRELLGDKKCMTLIDSTNVKSVEQEARKYYASEEATRNSKAVAVLTPTPVSRVLGNFYISLNKPPDPMKLFSTKDEAMAWLGQFKDEENL